MEIAYGVLVMAGVGSLLALLLEIAGKFLADYGEVSIDINAGGKQLEALGGLSLLATLREKKIFIPSACGGRGSCGECAVRVLEGGGPLLPTEEPLLSPEQIKKQIRISCQLKVRRDLWIEIPEELFLIKSWEAQLAKKTELNYDTVELRFALPENKTISFKPGQYIQLKSQDYGKVKQSVLRAYSISSSALDNRAIEIIVRKVPNGICTTWIHEHLQLDSKVELSGPYGQFYLRLADRPILMIAGGSGLAPIKSLLHQMQSEKIERKAVFVFGAVARKDLYHIETMNQFERELYDFQYIPALSNPSEEERKDWAGEVGLVTEVVKRRLEGEIAAYDAYLCGSPGMIEACINLLTEQGIPENRIYFDKFV